MKIWIPRDSNLGQLCGKYYKLGMCNHKGENK